MTTETFDELGELKRAASGDHAAALRFAVHGIAMVDEGKCDPIMGTSEALIFARMAATGGGLDALGTLIAIAARLEDCLRAEGQDDLADVARAEALAVSDIAVDLAPQELSDTMVPIALGANEESTPRALEMASAFRQRWHALLNE